MTGRFDWRAFYAAVDTFREACGLTWREVARQTGVGPSSLTRLGQGRRLNVDATLALVCWADLRLDDYVQREGSLKPSGLAMAVTFIYQDSSLTQDHQATLAAVLTNAYVALRKAQEDPK